MDAVNRAQPLSGSTQVFGAELASPWQQVKIFTGALASGKRIQVFAGRVSGSGLGQGTGAGIHTAIGGSRDAPMTQRGGPVPRHLAGSTTHGRETLQSRWAAQTIL